MEHLSFRKLQASDKMLLFEWSNDETARALSFSSKPINIEEHIIWFEKKLNDLNAFYQIIEWDGVPAGIVRYDEGETFTTVGINISKAFRGLGISSIALLNTAHLYFQKHSKPIFAFIKPENVVSLKAFENAGYELLRKDIVNGQEAKVFQLRKG